MHAIATISDICFLSSNSMIAGGRIHTTEEVREILDEEVEAIVVVAVVAELLQLHTRFYQPSTVLRWRVPSTTSAFISLQVNASEGIHAGE